MGNKLLNQFNIKEAERASPTDFNDLETCKLKFLLKKMRQPLLLPPSPNTRLGIIHHKVQEAAVKGKNITEDSLKKIWEDACIYEENRMLANSLEKRFVPLSKNVNMYNIQKRISIKQALERVNNHLDRDLLNIENQTLVESEKRIESQDKLIVGQIDLIISNNKNISIIDFKTGEIIDSITKEIKESYKKQLKLYAALYHDNTGIWPKKLFIIGYGTNNYNVPFELNECSDLFLQLKNMLKDCNNLVREGVLVENLGNANKENCKFCLYRPLCKTYWKMRTEEDGWPNDIRGKIINKFKDIYGNYKVIILAKNKEISIRGIDAEQNPFVKVGAQDAAFFNLYKEENDNNYCATVLTEGYFYDNE